LDWYGGRKRLIRFPDYSYLIRKKMLADKTLLSCPICAVAGVSFMAKQLEEEKSV
jgi:hypothetical protein